MCMPEDLSLNPAHMLKLGVETGALLGPLICQPSTRFRETLPQRNKPRNKRAGHQCNLWSHLPPLCFILCVCVCVGCHRHHRLFLNFLISLSLSHTPDYSLLFTQSGPQLVKGFLPKFRAGGPCSFKLTISVNTLRNTQRCVPWVFLNFGGFRRKANQGSMLTKIPGG